MNPSASEPAARPDRPVTVGIREGRRVARKRYTHARASEIYDDMRTLWSSPFGAPALLPGMPEPIGLENDDTVVMGAVDGSPVGMQWTLDGAFECGAACAGLLARFHASGVVVARHRRASGVIRSLRRKAARLSDGQWELAGQWCEALGALESLETTDERLVVSHGDFSPRNVLITARGELTMIDFDRLQMASPSRDVEHWRAWCWAAQVLQGSEPDWSLTEPFAAAYRNASQAHGSAGITADLVSGDAFHRSASLLRIAEAWTALRERPAAAQTIISEAKRVLGAG